MKRVTVREQAARRARNYHLWIYADEILNRPGRSYPGEVVAVCAPDGSPVGAAFYNPSARVALRLFSRKAELPDGDFWRRRIEAALSLREGMATDSTALRLVHAEGDYLPGLVVDRFGDHLCVQFRCAGMDGLRPLIVTLLREMVQPVSIFERSDLAVREEEGLASVSGQLMGETPRRVEVLENGVRFVVDIPGGQKTGFFTDQREARLQFARFSGPGKKILDAFSYTGAFALYSAMRGSEVLAVDKDADALAVARENASLNGVADRFAVKEADVFEWLIGESERGERYDAISLDPPALVKYKNQQGKGRGLLLDLIRPCLRMLDAGGILLVSTCAYHLTPDVVREAVRMAAADVGKRLLVVGETSQAGDHPWSVQMPETHYLRGLFLRVTTE